MTALLPPMRNPPSRTGGFRASDARTCPPGDPRVVQGRGVSGIYRKQGNARNGKICRVRKRMGQNEVVVPLADIEPRILSLRGQKAMLDSDLAELYGATTKRLNEQVRRNPGRFPPDFMLQLSAEETAVLRSQFATSKHGRGGRRYAPYAFTEHGAIVLRTC